MKPASAKTVAAVSFHDNHSISMDVDQVMEISMGKAMKLEEGQWFCELIIHSANGKVAIQMLADDPSRFRVGSDSEDELDTDNIATAGLGS